MFYRIHFDGRPFALNSETRIYVAILRQAVATFGHLRSVNSLKFSSLFLNCLYLRVLTVNLFALNSETRIYVAILRQAVATFGHLRSVNSLKFSSLFLVCLYFRVLTVVNGGNNEDI